MIRTTRLPILALACIAGALVLGADTPAQAAGSIKAAYVEQVVPASTWTASSGTTCMSAEVTTALHGGALEMDVNGVID